MNYGNKLQHKFSEFEKKGGKLMLFEGLWDKADKGKDIIKKGIKTNNRINLFIR